jgi:hypothetical protein
MNLGFRCSKRTLSKNFFELSPTEHLFDSGSVAMDARIWVFLHSAFGRTLLTDCYCSFALDLDLVLEVASPHDYLRNPFAFILASDKIL